MRLEIYGKNRLLREGNEKITLFIGEDPYAFISSRILFLKYSIDDPKSQIANELILGMKQFAKDYKWFYDVVHVNRDTIDFLTISI